MSNTTTTHSLSKRKYVKSSDYYTRITPENEELIIGYFLTLNNNSTHIIAKKLGLSYNAVSTSINRYINRKIKAEFVTIESKMNREDFID